MTIRIDWEWDDGSCNYATVEELRDAQIFLDELTVKATQMGVGFKFWIDQELFDVYMP